MSCWEFAAGQVFVDCGEFVDCQALVDFRAPVDC